MSNEVKKTAVERIKNLEETALGTLQALSQMNQEDEVIKEALHLLGNKVDAIVKLTNAGEPLTEENIATVMIQNKVNRMAEDTAKAVHAGVLIKTDTIGADSFVVSREVLEDGSVLNPRLQFTVAGAQESLRQKVLGAKALDQILVEEGKAKIEILEIYTITNPNSEAPAPAATEAEASAPAAEASSEAASAAPAQSDQAQAQA